MSLVLVAACGAGSATLPDAGTPPDVVTDVLPDVSPDGPHGEAAPLARVDWRTRRGPPFPAITATVPFAELFALSGGGFVTRSECVQGCNYTWRDLEGTANTRRENLFGVTSTVVSPDGRRALLVALEELENCIFSDQFEVPVARGTLQLLDLASGASSFDLGLRSNLWNAPAFTPLDDWFIAAPIQGTGCFGALGLRSTSSPFEPPPGLDLALQLVEAVDAQRWLVLRGFDLGLIDPATPNSFRFLAEDPSRFDVSHGWIHVYIGFALLAQDVLSLPPTGGIRQTTLRDQDWLPFGVQGRWIRVCEVFQTTDSRSCRVVDAEAEVAPVDFRVTITADHPDDAVLLVDGAVVYVGPLPNGNRAVQRVQFATGQHEILHPGDGKLQPLGNGAAALLLQDGAAWLIDAKRNELVAEQVRHVVSTPRLRMPGRGPARQDDVAALVLSPSTARTSLVVLDVRTRRLATLTDSLFFTPPPSGGFAFDGGCGQPWTTRHAGSVFEGLFQQAQHLFFVEQDEQGGPATIWLLPIDLSAPPRRLAELTGSTAACHVPLTSPDGSHVGFAEDGPDGTTTRITLSSEN